MERPYYKQFCELKQKHPDAVLLFRWDDTYCSFEQDADVLNEVLGCPFLDWEGRKAAGFPRHALDTYLPRLIRAGKRVAICDLLEKPKPTKKSVSTTPKQLTLF